MSNHEEADKDEQGQDLRLDGASSGADEKGKREALGLILESRFFVGQDKRGLLKYLFDRKDAFLSERTIADEFFGVRREDDVRQAYNSAAIRKALGAVRRGLMEYEKYAVLQTNWRIFFPPAQRDGYQLRFVNRNAEMEADHKFWHAHLEESRRIAIIYDEPLFYRDEVKGTVIRIPQIETGDGERAFKEAPAELQRLFRSEVTETLQPCHLYTLSGEVGARDHISDWFLENYGVKAEVNVSRLMRNVSDLAGFSPVILGNVRTSKILREITTLYQFGKFGYFVDAKGFRTVEVRNYTGHEEEILGERFKAEVVGKDLVLRDDPRPDKVVFAVVTRMPNIYDKRSCITMLSAGYTKVLETLAETLTSNQYLSEVLKGHGLDPNKPFPRYFQGLFSIRLGPTGTDDRPTRPALRCCRILEHFREAERRP